MIILEDTLISDDLIERKFCCDLGACRGACCIEGDRGAPINAEEVQQIRENLDHILPYVDKDIREEVKDEEFFEKDDDGDLVTLCHSDGRCRFVHTNENGIQECAIEKAHNDGLSTFLKPVSCHLYPVRLSEKETYTLVNYHEWGICNPARKNGSELGLPIYQFVKDALVRRFGEEWYEGLSKLAEEKFPDK